MTRSVHTVAWISLVLSATLSAATPVSADQPELARGGEWTVMGQQPPHSEIQSFQGEHTPDGGCHFDLDVTLAPGETVIRGDEVRRNLATCEAEFAIRKNEAVPKSSEDESGSSQSTMDESLTTGQPNVPNAYVYSIGYMKTWWTDPPGILVNLVENGVRWYWNNVNCLVRGSNWATYGWYPGSGWELLDDDLDSWANCSEQVSSSYARYRNWRFCAYIDTYTDYDRNTVRGKWDGWLVGETNSWVSGGCSSWLSRHWELKRTQN